MRVDRAGTGGVMYYWISFDCETAGVLPEYALQPWRFKQRKAWMTTAAYSIRGLDGSIVSRGKVYPKKADLEAMLDLAISQDATIVTWNGVFDIAWLLAYGLAEKVNRVRWLDAMRLWKHLDITASYATASHTYSLKGEAGAVGRFCPELLGYEAEIDYQTQDPAELKRLLDYNKTDTAATLMAGEAIWAQLDDKRRRCALIEASCFPMVAAANLEGMLVDKPAVKRLDRKLTETAAKLGAELLPHGITDKVIASPKQLAAVMYDQWNLPQLKGRSTSKDVLADLILVDDRVDQIRRYREANLLRAKFIGGVVKSVVYNEDGYSRPAANVYGTYTGRFTYNSTIGKKNTKKERQIGFALHQMKRDKEFKDMIVAPEGHDLVEFDAAGQEFRWMAILSADETMLQLCMPGEDAHSFMGHRISGLTYDAVREGVKADDPTCKRIRQGGKVGNLSLQYRTSPGTFRIRSLADHGMRITDAESRKICTTYKATYKGVPLYWSRQIAKGQRQGYAETLAGRRVQVRGNWAGPQQWPMESTMINFPIQGTGGDQKYLAMRVLKNRLPEYEARFAWDLHDGIYFYVPKAKSLKFAHDMRDVLAALPYDKAWDFHSPIPLPWDAKIGPSWGSLKEIK